MKEGPDIALLGALIGDPARANMLTALMSGKAHTASELAAEAGITVQTASSHLGKMESAGLLKQRRQGRHKYFSLSDDDVGAALEALMGVAAARGHMRTRTGPRDPALRKARICYDHLAGELGVRLYDSLMADGSIEEGVDAIRLTPAGEDRIAGFGVDLAPVMAARRPVCRACLDWSQRRSHLAGSLGAALLDRFYDLGWARREDGTRVIAFSRSGEAKFDEAFPTAVG